MDTTLINPFLNSVLNVLSTMAKLKATPGKMSLKKGQVALGNVTGLIGMVGNKVKGTFAITFSDEVVLEIAKRMLGEELTKIDDTVIDLVGELTNMVTGGAKRILSEDDHKFNMALPSVISGENHVIIHNSKVPIIMVPFSTESGDFFIEICFEE